MDEQTSRRNRIIFIIVVCAVVLLLLGALIAVLSSVFAPKNPYGNSAPIPGYDNLIKNLSPDYKDNITAQLYQTIKLNNPKGPDPSKISDITLRTNSVTQEVLTSQKQYTGSFIVDIASLGQSYKIQYTYSTGANDPILGGYPIIVSCPDKTELIYGEFNCKTTYDQSNTPTDPIVQYVPYSTLDYEIAAIQNDDNSVTLKVQLSLSDADYKTGKDQAVAQKKQEVLDWITSKGIDPSKYQIDYSY
jgi:flagellar basal body-associated protein FliL